MNLPTPKHDFKAEQALIGCLMHACNNGNSDSIELILDLEPAVFFNQKLRAIFEATRAMNPGHEQLDPALIARRCKFEQPAAEIMEAMSEVVGDYSTQHYIEIVRECAAQRTVIVAAEAAVNAGDSAKAVEILRSGLESLSQSEGAQPLVTAAEATEGYLRFLSVGDRTMPRAALRELDHALGGGVDFGEMVVVAARPSHGKTAIALQFAHNWTEDGMPVLYVSLEMSANAIGKRIAQYSSDVPEEYWRSDMRDVQSDLAKYHSGRADLFISDRLKTLESIVREVERSVKHRGIKAVVIDYAQLIQGPGKTRYEQITNISTVLRGLASDHRIIMLVLAQMSREIESRKHFVPVMSDIKESGQFEQDADVVMFLVWPHRINSQQPAHEYQFFIAKNRSRPILSSAFTARFEPARQRVVSPKVRDMPNYEPAFADYDPFDIPE